MRRPRGARDGRKRSKALWTLDNDRRQFRCGVWARYLLVALRPLAQENAKPRAEPTTTTVKKSGSAIMRQLLRNDSPIGAAARISSQSIVPISPGPAFAGSEGAEGPPEGGNQDDRRSRMLTRSNKPKYAAVPSSGWASYFDAGFTGRGLSTTAGRP